MAEQDKFEAMEIKTRKQLEEAALAKKKKKRNYIVGFSLLGAATLGLVAVYVLAAQVWLVDIKYLPYVEYTYDIHGDHQTATLRKVKGSESNPIPEHFVIPNKVNGLTITAIADNAFAGLEHIKSIKMSDNITSIGSYAFAGCKDLEDIKFSNNISYLGTDVFKGCDKFLEKLPSDGISTISSILFKVGDQVIKDKTILLASKDSQVPSQYASYNKFYLDEYEGQKLLGWGEGLFAGNNNIVYAEIPSYLLSLPANSFKDCKNLEYVKFTDNTTKINEYAFTNTPKLKKVELGDNINTIGDYAFSESGLEELDIGVEVKKVGKGIFKDCKDLTSFTWPEHLTTIPNETFSGCSKLNNLTITDTSYQNIVSIGKEAFMGTKLTSFDFPIHLSDIPEGAFRDAKELESVTMYESERVFDKEGNEYSHGIQLIGFEAFKNTKLKEIRLVDENRNKVSPANEVNLPSTVLNMSLQSSKGENFASDNVTFSKFTFPYNLISTSTGMFKNNTHLTTLEFKTHHGEGEVKGLQVIAPDTFSGTTQIKHLNNLPESITSIASRGLANMMGLEDVKFPSNAKFKVLDESVLENNTNLKKVEIFDNVYSINRFAFHNNFNLEYAYIPFVGELDGNKSKLNLEHGAFFNMRDIRAHDPITGETGGFYDDVVVETPLTEEEKFPIFLELTKDQLDTTKAFDPAFDLDGLPILDKPGWYDKLTCHVYFKGEWKMDNGRPVPLAKGGNQ